MTPNNDNPERQNQVFDLLRAAAESERAPDSLHARIAVMRDQAALAPRRRPRRPAFAFTRLALPVTAALAAALVLVLGGAAGTPSIAQAAALASRAPTAAAPKLDRSEPSKQLSAKVGSLHFPNWRADGGWRPIGQRHDSVGNRRATTVYYANASGHLAYSIVSSPTLPGLKTHGEPYETILHRGRVTVVWEEAGHTCLLTGTDIAPARLWQLATFGFRKPL